MVHLALSAQLARATLRADTLTLLSRPLSLSRALPSGRAAAVTQSPLRLQSQSQSHGFSSSASGAVSAGRPFSTTPSPHLAAGPTEPEPEPPLPLWERQIVPEKRGSAPPPEFEDREGFFAGELEPRGWGFGMSEGGARTLTNTYRFRTYRSAAAFVQAIVALADAEKHHPRVVLEYGRVEVHWWSHSNKGLTINDYIMAAKTEKIAEHAEGRRQAAKKTTDEEARKQ